LRNELPRNERSRIRLDNGAFFDEMVSLPSRKFTGGLAR